MEFDANRDPLTIQADDNNPFVTLSADVDPTTSEYLGRWNRLISTTNWEKGRIIHDWREALTAQGAPASEYSDEAWSLRAGQVSSQHVGRLRRTFTRFGGVHADYSGLYWSHFQAALEWAEAELWLEGAVQNGWSVAQMRDMRWQTLGSLPQQRPIGEIVASEADEEISPIGDGGAAIHSDPSVAERLGAEEVRSAQAGQDATNDVGANDGGETVTMGDVPADRPFESLPVLPDDMTEAWESLKLAIVRHKLRGWTDVSPGDVMASLDALKRLVSAAS